MLSALLCGRADDSPTNVANTKESESLTSMYDALIIVQLGSGQLSHGTAKGTQARFDALLSGCTFDAKLVWSSPKIQTKMGVKDVLFQIDNLNSCLHDTLAYYSEMELIKGFMMTCAFEPRVIKQSCGSEGKGIWLCWQWDKASTTKVAIVPITQYTEDSLDDGDYLTMMEMSDNHVDFHAVRECITPCIRDYDASGARVWTSSFADKYLEGGKAAGSKLIDQRLPPCIVEATHIASTLRCRGGGGEPTHTNMQPPPQCVILCTGEDAHESDAGVEADISYEAYLDMCKLSSLVGVEAIEMLETANAPKPARFNTLLASLKGAMYKLAVVQIKVLGAKDGGAIKREKRINSIRIANGVIAASGECDLILCTPSPTEPETLPCAAAPLSHSSQCMPLARSHALRFALWSSR